MPSISCLLEDTFTLLNPRISLLSVILAGLVLAATAAADTPTAQSGSTLQPIPLEDMEVSVLAPVALQAVQIPQSIILDGRLTEPAWQNAPVGDDFRQREPDEGAPASQPTEVRVLYTATHLYVGVICHDSDVSAAVATRFNRDADLAADDRVTLLFDTFADRRNAFKFQTNSVGARVDELIGDEGETENRDWNGIWNVKTARSPSGWSAEFEIPFQTLSYAPGQSSWGFNVQRIIKRVNEETVWSGYLQSLDFNRVSRAGRLTGLRDRSQGLGLDFSPFLTTEVRRDAASFKPGFDLFYKPTPGLTLSLTLNTDFSEAETDDVQVNLTRFSLFFPEKRQFFLEDAPNFAVDGLTPTSGPLVIIPFFSRRVGIADDGKPVDLIGGAKLSGRVGKYSLGILSAQTQERDPVPGENFSVVRLKRDLGEQASLGLIATRRTPENGDASGLYGHDFLYKTTRFLERRNLTLSSFVLKSFRPTARKNWAWGSQINLPNDTWTIFGTYREVQRDFEASMGFVPRTGIRRFGWFLQAAPRPGRWGTRQVACAFDGNYITDQSTNRLLTRNIVFPCEWRFESGDTLMFRAWQQLERLTEDFEISRGVRLLPDRYTFRRYMVKAETADKRKLSASLAHYWGDYYSGTRDSWNLRLNFQPGPRLFLSPEYLQSDVRLPEGNFVTRLLRVRLDIAVSPDLSWFSLIQYDNVSDVFSLNTRIRWIIEPGNDIFLVFNQRWLDEEGGFHSIGREGRFKVRYTYRF